MSTISKDRASLRYFPEDVLLYRQMTGLSLQYNHIAEIPKQIGELSQLTTLLLSGNRLAKLPEEIGLLCNLHTLRVDSNELTDVPYSLGQLSSLRQLFLNRNQLAKLPDNLSELGNLRTLQAEENQLSELPDTIGSLSLLSSLDLSGNQLSCLPASFLDLTRLETLDLARNRLDEIPSEVEIPSLIRLDLSGNNIRSIPDFMERMVNLQTLNLNQNPLPKLQDVLHQHNVNNIISLAPEYIPTEFLPLQKLRIRQELLQIKQTIQQSFLTRYRSPNAVTLSSLQAARTYVEQLSAYWTVAIRFNPTLNNLNNIIPADLTEEWLHFQINWTTALCDYQSSTSERRKRRLHRISLPLTQEDVIFFNKVRKRAGPPLVNRSTFVMGTIVGAFFVLLLFLLA